uniref:Uncharacterized protein n=1 Tax=Utricularia reniformis TaxID=192314 RepID=A0A1Y0B4W2_9LAMI|nr:hypothetical protein AEK19_MT2289 [Utricularia reniformis]ART32434.1 hypothetical protein AEK19_MT2289 [Utricularia reniformis]
MLKAPLGGGSHALHKVFHSLHYRYALSTQPSIVSFIESLSNLIYCVLDSRPLFELSVIFFQ